MIAVSSQSKLILKNIFHHVVREILIGSEFGDLFSSLNRKSLPFL